MTIPGYTTFELNQEGISKLIYRKGEGPGVILLHELPGLIPECLQLADRITEAGYTVFIPLLFGKPGTPPATIRHSIQLCLSREFTLFRTGQKSPISDWLRWLAREVRAQTGGPIGVIGMCLTGGYVLAMMIEEGVEAPVCCQPSLPFGFGLKSQLDLGLSADQLAAARTRSQQREIPVLGFRFDGDWICPAKRFQALEREFSGRFQGQIIPGDRHAVLTVHFRDIPEALQDHVWSHLFRFLNERLKDGAGIIPPKP